MMDDKSTPTKEKSRDPDLIIGFEKSRTEYEEDLKSEDINAKMKKIQVKIPESFNSSELHSQEIEVLKDHIRLLKGLQIKQKPIKRIPKIPENVRVKINLAHMARKACIRRRKINRHISELKEIKESDKILSSRMQRESRKQRDLFSLNNAFQLRWKNTRGFPVMTDYYKETVIETGKPPFTVPVHYKPFNVYWDADWAKQEFLFLDADSSTTAAPTNESSTSVADSTQTTDRSQDSGKISSETPSSTEAQLQSKDKESTATTSKITSTTPALTTPISSKPTSETPIVVEVATQRPVPVVVATPNKPA